MSTTQPAHRLQLFGAIAALGILILDQASKWWVLEVFDLPAKVSVPVLPMLNLTMVWNRGITFGLLSSDSTLAATLLAALALGVVVALGLWLRRAERLPVALALGAVSGGAVGNVIDRLRFGAVFDFIDFYVGDWHWPAFNLADSAIFVGVVLLLFDSLFHQPDRGKNSAGSEAP